MRRLSIGMRLTLWYLTIFAVAQLAFGAGMWFVLQRHLFDIVDDGLEGQFDDLKSFLRTQGADPDLAHLREEVNQTYAIERQGNYMEVYAENGEVVYRSVFFEDHPLPMVPPAEAGKAAFRDYRIEGRPFRIAAEKLTVSGHPYTATMAVPMDDVVQTLALFRSYLWMFAPLLLLAAAGGGYWLSRRALAPVDALARTAREISGANLSSRLEKLATGDELQRLADTLNEMLDRIESAFLRITQFTADASHELRTPMALIRTEAELALRRSRSQSEYKESLRQVLLEAERTTTLIEQLLSMARCDSGRETLRMERVDLRETLQSVVEGWARVASTRNLQFSATIAPQELFVMGDQDALRRLTGILLDNAVKYTPAQGSVSLVLEPKNDSAVISVVDSGVGIVEEEQPKIFERFYRVDKARSREQGGAGLGLAIAQWIVVQHQGSIGVESRPGEGSVFRVELPAIAAPVRSPLLTQPAP